MSGSLRNVTKALQAALVLLVVAWVLNIPGRLGIALYTEQFLATVLGITLALTFLTIPARGHNADGGTFVDPASRRIAWYDLIAATAGFAACLYIAIRYPVLVTELVYRPADGIAVATVICFLVMEATRRMSGWSLIVIILGLCAYALLGWMLPDEIATRPVALSRLMVYLGIDTNALLGGALQVAAIVVVPFVIMGQVLTRCGGSDYFTDLSMAMMGRFRGGSAKIAVVGSAFFGMVSGSAVANVASVGTITIPLMKRAGFPGHLAAAIESVGSTGGQLMPPVMGAAAFLMAEYLQVPYSEVMVAAILPAFLYYAALFVQVDLEAAKRRIAGAPLAQIPPLGRVLREGWHFPIPFVVLVLGLLMWNMEAEYAALIATALLIGFAMVFGYKGNRLSLRAALSAVVSAGGAVIDIIVITAVAGLLIGVLNLTGLAFGLTLQLLSVSGGSLVVLLAVTAVVAIILGLGLPTVGVYVILAALAAPALIKAGISPMQAHMFVMYFGMMSMVTPPVALAAFAAANIAQSDHWKTGWTATRVGWCSYIIPFLFALSPTLLMKGLVLDIVASTVTALIGVLLGTAAVVGHLRDAVPAGRRVLYLVVGVILLVPTDMFSGAGWLNLAAFAVGGVLLAYEFGRPRAAPALSDRS
jgi:TRAP transporter 4TM/12TM fusion protein